MSLEADYLIVGGGSAGCVLANRLSASSKNRVILIEAGRDTPPDRPEEAILDSYPRIAYFDPRNTWADLRVHLEPVPHNAPERAGPARRYEQARLMGGGSSLNDMQANRGTPDDYAEWVAMGARDWSWEHVLESYRRIERDLDFDGPMHGKSGALPIRRIGKDVWPGFTKAAAVAFAAAGYPELHDQNGEFGDGYFPVAISNIYDRRVSSATAFLDNATRRRPNLTILADTELKGLVVDGARVVGGDVLHKGSVRRITARETIVCAGGIHSPAILLRAGIGPAAQLRSRGVAVVADRPGVGANLMEHPTISISCHIAPEARLPKSLRRHIHLALRWTSSVKDCAPQDMYMVTVTKTGWHPVGECIGSLMTWVNKPFSRGRVTLAEKPAAEPRVEFELLSDKRDVDRLKEGMRLIAGLYEKPSLRAVARDPFPTSYSERLRDLGVVSTKNLIATSILAKLLDGPASLRKTLIEKLVVEGDTLEALMGSDDLLEQFVRTKAHGVWHASGTCRMGDADDRDAVTTSSGKVIGVEGLRVVDASIMPTIPRANTNLPTIMIGDRISDLILAEA
ncbi:MAG: GMC family oxidoreductase N-terminal domain-containing protein [Hyphomicrobiales bacterium]